jgi:hypothetical protein
MIHGSFSLANVSQGGDALAEALDSIRIEHEVGDGFAADIPQMVPTSSRKR